MAWDGIERRKSFCPLCVTRRAKPVSTTEGAGRKIIHYECEECGFQWTAEYDAAATSDSTAARPLILLIDEGHDSVDLLSQALATMGWNITYAFDADTGFDIARMASPRAVVIDSQLAGDDAWRFVERLKASLVEVPTILLSADDSPEMRLRAQAAGFAAIATKPCEPEVLARLIQDALP